MQRRKYNLPFAGRFPETEVGDIPDIVTTLPKKERATFWLLFWVFAISLLALLARLNSMFLVEVPTRGGSFTEGILGGPAFINPVVADADPDRDMVALIYSGLLRQLRDGSLSLDLASGYTVSDDGLIYTVTLRDNAVFHDGKPVTADDVVFTIEKIKDPSIGSPARASWSGIGVEKIDNRTVAFSLGNAYALFPENLMIGIIPKHVWNNVPTDEFLKSTLNTNIIGSGPYKIARIKRDENGIATSYDLGAFDDFVGGRPFIDEIRINVYGSGEELARAYESGSIDVAGGLSPSWVAERKGVVTVAEFPIARIFGVFFNQNTLPLFADEIVRRALLLAVDKEKIVEKILFGYGESVSGPVPESVAPSVKEIEVRFDKEAARALLAEGGWKLNTDGIFEKTGKDKKKTTLSFALSTSDVPDLKQAAEELKKDWEDIGANVSLKVFGGGTLQEEVIRPREYDALLFGEVVGQNPDLYAFWHSSQRLDPGLNIALYANITADKLLEKARLIENREERFKT